MFKFIFSITFLGFIMTSQEAFSIQIIQENRKPSFGQRASNALGYALYGSNQSYQENQQRERNEMNRIEEKQELLREQVRIHQEMLDFQKHQHYFVR